jgi:esterase/lipase
MSQRLNLYSACFHGILSVFFAVFLNACGHSSTASAPAGCLDHIQHSLQNIDAQHADIRPGNASVLLRGDPARVVFLLHGFISSPAEVMSLGQALASRGYTVVMPLMAGFGRSTEDAENTTTDEWVQTTQAQLEASTACGSKVQVIGFSLGALLETKVLLDHPQLQDQVASLTLVSPALKIKNNSMMNVGAFLFRAITSTPNVSFLAGLARTLGDEDLNIPEAHPEFYNTQLPMRLVSNLNQVVESIDFSLFANFAPPVKVIYSESDHTVDGAAAYAGISVFHPNTTVMAIPAEKSVPHQILLADVPGLLSEVTNAVIENFR